ncbi:MAG: NAD-dependent succinate-semialdehyde dehydrogenase [Kangiellaceae bacterium]|nr:NAD-dependent succinate-semialdehyde dehydrogenase [Kangiellaceae bacterium]
MQSISNQSIINHSSFINGEWVESNHRFEVTNPADQSLVARVAVVEIEQIKVAINSAYRAQKEWQALEPSQRTHLLMNWQKLLRNNCDDLARLMTIEQGKPLAESKAEILHSADYTQLYAELSENYFKAESVASPSDQQAEVLMRPVGVVSAITPWNFPCSMVVRKAAAALSAGCSVVLKPSEMTPLTALALAQLSKEAGIPAGVFNVVVGTNAQAIGELLSQHPKVAKLSFTGSTKVGKKLLAQCALGVKRTSMELGGNAPFIVFDDADLDKVVEGAIASKFRNSGQTCVSANRFLIHQDIAEQFKSKLLEATKKLTVGNGTCDVVDFGPLINQKAVEKARLLVKDAVSQGAELLLEGDIADLTGSYCPPVILTNVRPNMRIFSEEIFAPVVSIITFENERQAIQLANQSELGLCGYLYTADQLRIERMSEQLELGMLGVNQAKLSNPAAPFGGVKQSGMGREGGRFGIEEYLDYQYISQAIKNN